MTAHATTGRALPPARGFAELVKVEGKLSLRVPMGLFLGVVVPVILLVIFSMIPGLKQLAPGSTLTMFAEYVPVLIGLSLCMLALRRPQRSPASSAQSCCTRCCSSPGCGPPSRTWRRFLRQPHAEVARHGQLRGWNGVCRPLMDRTLAPPEEAKVPGVSLTAGRLSRQMEVITIGA